MSIGRSAARRGSVGEVAIVSLALAVAVVGCARDGGADGLTVEGLRSATECPVDLDAALDELDLEADGPTEVRAGDPDPDSDVAAADGALVSCRLGEVRVLLFASAVDAGSEQPIALTLALPLVADELGFGIEELRALADDVGADPPVGEVIDVGVDGGLVVVPVASGEADPAIVVVTSETVAHDDLVALAEHVSDQIG